MRLHLYERQDGDPKSLIVSVVAADPTVEEHHIWYTNDTEINLVDSDTDATEIPVDTGVSQVFVKVPLGGRCDYLGMEVTITVIAIASNENIEITGNGSFIKGQAVGMLATNLGGVSEPPGLHLGNNEEPLFKGVGLSVVTSDWGVQGIHQTQKIGGSGGALPTDAWASPFEDGQAFTVAASPYKRVMDFWVGHRMVNSTGVTGSSLLGIPNGMPSVAGLDSAWVALKLASELFVDTLGSPPQSWPISMQVSFFKYRDVMTLDPRQQYSIGNRGGGPKVT